MNVITLWNPILNFLWKTEVLFDYEQNDYV